MQSSPIESEKALFRHILATLAYRSGKVLRGTPRDFATFTIGSSSRTPGEILAHIGDLLDWALSQMKGSPDWREQRFTNWEEGVSRFHQALERLDTFLLSASNAAFPLGKVFQGPIADALTHVGQLAMMRRLAGSPIRGENYFVADIQAGRLGPEQALPRKEFD